MLEHSKGTIFKRGEAYRDKKTPPDNRKGVTGLNEMNH